MTANVISRITDYFIPSKIGQEKYELFKSRVLINFLLIMILVACAMYVIVLSGAIKDDFPFPLILLLFLSLLFGFKFTGRRVLIANVAIAGILIGGFSNILASGGIYSFNIRWTIIPVVIAFLISDKRSAIIVLIVNIFTTFYIYYVSTADQWNDAKFSAETYLSDNIFLMLLVSALVYLFYKGQEQLSKEIEYKNDRLEQQNLTLQLQKEELNAITTKLVESNQKLENYGHHTAHDIIQPASTISQFAQLIIRDIERDTITNKTRDFAELVKKSSLSLIEMSKNLLSFAKTDFEAKIQKEKIDLNDLINQVKIKLTDQISKSNTQITTCKLPEILGVETQIASVFQNVISNAIIYRKKNIVPEIEVQYEKIKGTHLISFIDNGIGIPKDHLETIFNSFERVNSNGAKGTGLGLPICKQIIEHHDGRIWAESTVGLGTTIHIELPLTVDAPHESLVATAQALEFAEA